VNFSSIPQTLLISPLDYRQREMILSSIRPLNTRGSSHAILAAGFADIPFDEPKI
jgi:hypothetical protein